MNQFLTHEQTQSGDSFVTLHFGTYQVTYYRRNETFNASRLCSDYCRTYEEWPMLQWLKTLPFFRESIHFDNKEYYGIYIPCSFIALLLMWLDPSLVKEIGMDYIEKVFNATIMTPLNEEHDRVRAQVIDTHGSAIGVSLMNTQIARIVPEVIPKTPAKLVQQKIQAFTVGAKQRPVSIELPTEHWTVAKIRDFCRQKGIKHSAFTRKAQLLNHVNNLFSNQ